MGDHEDDGCYDMNAKPICTAENPAPPVDGWSSGVNHSRGYNRDYDHPDETSEEIDSDHGDMRYTCPHCKQSMISEGIDS